MIRSSRNAAIVVIALSLGTVSYAAPVSWSFGSDPAKQYSTTETTGKSFNSSAGTMPVIVYAEQVNSSGVLKSTPDSSLSGLFSTSAAVEPGFETGIAPYNPQDNNYPYNNQGGTYNNQDGITSTNILELDISAVAKGASLSFLLQGPVGDSITVYTGDVNAPTNLGSMTVYDKSAETGTGEKPIGLTTTAYGGVISPTGTAAIFTLTRDTAANEFVAIQADCHYLLLTSITDSPAPTPEPRFYGLLLISLLAIPAVRRRFVPQQ